MVVRFDKTTLSKLISLTAVVFSFAYLGCGGGGTTYRLPSPVSFGAVSDEQIAALKPGGVSRREILFALGEPGERLQNDRFLIYGWNVTSGIKGYIYAGPNTFLCLEFDASGRLRRHAVRSWDYQAQIDEWLKADEVLRD